jgi:hypothetical protein
VANTYGRANESAIGVALARGILKPGGMGVGVLISDAPEGRSRTMSFAPGARVWRAPFRTPPRGIYHPVDAQAHCPHAPPEPELPGLDRSGR